jgi:hypothetical protein
MRHGPACHWQVRQIWRRSLQSGAPHRECVNITKEAKDCYAPRFVARKTARYRIGAARRYVEGDAEVCGLETTWMIRSGHGAWEAISVPRLRRVS